MVEKSDDLKESKVNGPKRVSSYTPEKRMSRAKRGITTGRSVETLYQLQDKGNSKFRF